MCIGLTTLVLAGTALSALGTATSTYSAVKQAEATKQQIGIQQQIEAQRKQQMELQAHRQQLETVRQMQRARSQALTSATNQGAIFGSGLQGGYGQIGGATATNQLGISQNLEIGRNIFGLNQQLSQSRIQSAGFQSIGSVGSGLSSLGSNITNSALAFNRLTQPATPYSRSANPYNTSQWNQNFYDPRNTGTFY